MDATTDVQRVPPAKLNMLIAATSIGNALEWYDIVIYGYFALAISHTFFPASDPTTGLLLALGTFGVSYISRPLGAIVLGGYADRVGRKPAMLVSILLMVFGTSMIVFMPGFATIGIAAPVGILIARLIQGFSAGGEFGSATAFLVEHAPERRGYIASWQFASQGLSAMAASLFGIGLSALMPNQMLLDWGWRIPFAMGLLVGPVGLWIRRNLEEPPHSGARVSSPLRVLAATQKVAVLVAIGCLVISTAISYMLVYMPIFAVREMGQSTTVGFVGAFVGSVVLTILTPFVGHLSDRIGRTKIMLASAVLMLISFYPCFSILLAFPSVQNLVLVVLWLATLKSAYFGALPALMSELFPSGTRAIGLSMAYNIGVPIFGGLAPFTIAWLTSATGDSLAASYYLMAVSVLSIVALVAARRRFGLH